jgi:hypothetical protein
MEATTPPPPPPPVAEPPPPPPSAAGGDYPVQLDAQRQDSYHRFLPLVKWLLAFPHYIVLVVLAIGVLFAKIYAFFVVLFTGRYPEGVFKFVVAVLRWSWNVNAYVVLLTDRYPPFSLEADPSYPAQFDVVYPTDGIDNWRPLVQWLLIIPYALVAYVLGILARLVALVGVFVILFTKELPRGMFDLILIPHRWQYRATAYGMFLVKRYPPFAWDE